MSQSSLNQCRYDDALPRFTRLLIKYFTPDFLKENAVLRDADGVLTLILRTSANEHVCSEFSKAAQHELSGYAASEPIATPSDLFDPTLADPAKDQWELVHLDGSQIFVRLIERRIVGQDWMRGIQSLIPQTPPIVVFASLKGGVGRSTALAIASAQFAAQGKSILVIDLDLEAPGLGNIFLPRQQTPLYGALDYYVENGRGSIDNAFLQDMLASSPVTYGDGSVDVVVAVGQRCRDYPENVIGKLSRAYIEDIGTEESGLASFSFLDQTRTMISDLCGRKRYDAVFVDARAGLNETTAATLQGLGADVLFFGVDTPQTWEGYRYLLAHLARFKAPSDEEDWRFRLKMIHAKAVDDPAAWSKFRDNAFELFAEHLYDELDETDLTSSSLSPFGFDLDDSAAPHYAWPILVDSAYLEFDPIGNDAQLTRDFADRSYGVFITKLAERLDFS